jgi:photosystem II stability/assembly factor-like uncharacterized protein
MNATTIAMSRSILTTYTAVIAVLIACLAGGTAKAQNAAAARPAPAARSFADPLDHPARPHARIAKRPFMTVVQAGRQLVAAGSRGVIAVSSDMGETWHQAAVPVQSDLLAVSFPTPEQGWAVGHDGVILHSADGGRSWTRQLDGRSAEKLFKQAYEAAAAQGDTRAQAALATLAQNYKAGPSLPMLDVWFADAKNGYAVGSFGMLAATHDGGKTWEPWLHRIDNPDQLNLNAVYGFDGHVLIAAERGRIFRFDPQSQGFVAVETGYPGSFFGFAGGADALLTFGLRGIVYRSADSGKSWQEVPVPGGAAIAAAGRTRAGDFVLVNAIGDIILGNRQGNAFQLVKPSLDTRLTGVAVLEEGSIVTTGISGIRKSRLPHRD